MTMSDDEIQRIMRFATKQHDSGANRQTSERERLAAICDAQADTWSIYGVGSDFRKAAAQLRAAEAEIAQLREIVAQGNSGRPDDWLIAENDRLRAENEALRTVTPDEVEGFLTVLAEQNCQGVEHIHYAEILAALQSFIRSKESSRG